jgi:hypothetical protein
MANELIEFLQLFRVQNLSDLLMTFFTDHVKLRPDLRSQIIHLLFRIAHDLPELIHLRCAEVQVPLQALDDPLLARPAVPPPPGVPSIEEDGSSTHDNPQQKGGDKIDIRSTGHR